MTYRNFTHPAYLDSVPTDPYMFSGWHRVVLVSGMEVFGRYEFQNYDRPFYTYTENGQKHLVLTVDMRYEPQPEFTHMEVFA